MLGEVCAQQAPRLLGWPDGERRLGNYLQLAEDLQGARGRAPRPRACWPNSSGASPTPTPQRRRTAATGVRCRAGAHPHLHVSKGLTLDLVFLPYCATAVGGARRSEPPMARVHDGLARVGVLFAESGDAACQQEAAELRAEQVRLLYVGLTRRDWRPGWLGPCRDAHRTALGWLLHRAVDGSLPDKLDAAVTDDALRALRACAPQAIAIEAGADPPRWPRCRACTSMPARHRRRRARSGARWTATGGCTASPSWRARTAAPRSARPTTSSTARRSRRRRAAVALLRHALRQRAARGAGARGLRGLARPSRRAAANRPARATGAALQRAGFASEADQLEGVPVLSALVGATLNARMPEGPRLADLPPSQRLAEMEFHLALAPLQVDALLDLLHAHGVVPARRNFGERRRLEGLLTGRIDMVYEHDGRFHVLDYKSNLLPATMPPRSRARCSDSEYDLQYVLYTWRCIAGCASASAPRTTRVRTWAACATCSAAAWTSTTPRIQASTRPRSTRRWSRRWTACVTERPHEPARRAARRWLVARGGPWPRPEPAARPTPTRRIGCRPPPRSPAARSRTGTAACRCRRSACCSPRSTPNARRQYCRRSRTGWRCSRPRPGCMPAAKSALS
jgi:exodeoxyribonuclease V beta subunit